MEVKIEFISSSCPVLITDSEIHFQPRFHVTMLIKVNEVPIQREALVASLERWGIEKKGWGEQAKTNLQLPASQVFLDRPFCVRVLTDVMIMACQIIELCQLFGK